MLEKGSGGNMSALKKISSNLYQWSEFSTEKQLNFNGYYLIHNGEAVIKLREKYPNIKNQGHAFINNIY